MVALTATADLIDSPARLAHPLAMRLLVACSDCKRHYDASQLAAGSRFRCLCGHILQVERPMPHDAAVVRCSSCGAPRQGESAACRFCDADFTLHERDLHTICPACMTRVSDRARFCHHCASPLLCAAVAGEPSTHPCPVCGDERHLTSRRVGDPGIGVLECPHCAGMWLANDELELLLERIRVSSPASEVGVGGAVEDYRTADPVTQEGPLYRPCPVCTKLMHRRNFGRKSGIIVDHCRAHGFWFDAQELESILRWMKRGGEVEVARLEDDERREASRRQEFDRQLEPADANWPPSRQGTGALVDLLGWVVGRVLG